MKQDKENTKLCSRCVEYYEYENEGYCGMILPYWASHVRSEKIDSDEEDMAEFCHCYVEK